MSLPKSASAPALFVSRAYPALTTTTLVDTTGFVVAFRTTDPFWDGPPDAVPLAVGDLPPVAAEFPPMRAPGAVMVPWAAVMNLPFQASAYNVSWYGLHLKFKLTLEQGQN